MGKAGSKTEHYDKQLRHVLLTAAEVFAEKGYHHASIRDISRRTGISLAGLYYYFDNKEELLYLIIHSAFDTALEQLRASVGNYEGPDKVRFFIRNHLATFIEHLSVAKVVVHEAGNLSGRYYEAIHEQQREYFDLLLELLEAQRPSNEKPAVDSKLAALLLFGMMNWIYTWFDPEKSRSTQQVADAMADIFLEGFLRA